MRDTISVLEENSNIQEVVQYLDENMYIYKGYIGFPNYYYDGAHLNIDAILVTKKGVLAFVDESVNDVNTDDVYNKLDIVLRGVPALINRRKLIAKIDVFCLGQKDDSENYTFSTKEKVLEEYLKIANDYVDLDERKLDIIINAIEGCLVKEQKNRHTSKITNAIAKLENSISKYDNKQLECLKDYENKVQVISGLAGSGKTVILCKKIAQLILNNNEANICITFFSRSLKKQIRNMIKSFLERTTDNVDFLLNKIEIVNSWGDSTGDGFYSSLCKELNINHIPYYVAKQKNKEDPFLYCCKELLKYIKDNNINCQKYDYVFIDEAQDLNEAFLKLCQMRLKENGKLVYAYDEFQDLNDRLMQSPEEIFGKDVSYINTPLATCYRTPKQILVTAHSIGMGLNSKDGICQFFDNEKIWGTIGYTLDRKSDMTIARREQAEYFNDLNEEIYFIDHNKFDDIFELQEYLVNEIENDIKNNHLNYDDVMVIDLAKWETSTNYNIFNQCAKGKFDTALAGDNDPNVFFEKDKIIYSYVHRAKGNEAYKVYIVNSQLSMNNLLRDIWRNRLFTSMTRSKLQVVLLSINNEQCDLLEKEINQVKNNEYNLIFSYPTKEEIKKAKNIAKQNLKTSKVLNDTSKAIDELQKLNPNEQVDHLSELIKGKFDEDTLQKLIQSLSQKKDSNE